MGLAGQGLLGLVLIPAATTASATAAAPVAGRGLAGDGFGDGVVGGVDGRRIAGLAVGPGGGLLGGLGGLKFEFGEGVHVEFAGFGLGGLDAGVPDDAGDGIAGVFGFVFGQVGGTVHRGGLSQEGLGDG